MTAPEAALFANYHARQISLSEVAVALGCEITEAYDWAVQQYYARPSLHTYYSSTCPACGAITGPHRDVPLPHFADPEEHGRWSEADARRTQERLTALRFPLWQAMRRPAHA